MTSSPSIDLRHSMERLISEFAAGDLGTHFLEARTEIMDQYFRSRFQESEAVHSLFKNKNPFAIVALGGYGRKELCLHSDIDVMLLFGPKVPSEAKAVSDDLFLPLWDLGVDLGYAVRTIRDCQQLCKQDFQVLTSLIDSRFFCGDSRLYLSFWERLHKKIITAKAHALARWLERDRKSQSRSRDDSGELLEPHLKNGMGGLRYYHHILWLSKASFELSTPKDLEYLGKLSHSEYEALMSHLDFIWLVRNHLHYASGRKNDRLGLQYQEAIAANLGFRDHEDEMAVERFMGVLHSSMASIKELRRSFLMSQYPELYRKRKGPRRDKPLTGLTFFQGELYFESATTVLENPLLLMEIFRQSALSGDRLSVESRRLVREFLYLVDDTYRESPRASDAFQGILGGEHTFPALEDMLETGLLEAFIPEFKKIKNRVQFDTYHIFPVGRHLLETVKNLKNLHEQNELLLPDILSEIRHPLILLLAALLHDIGKVGRHHAEKGAEISRDILKRLGFAGEKEEDVVFLVSHHLMLAETATRRDLNDEKMIVQCAAAIGNEQRLKMLYLLTWADSKATGPRAWSSWIADLVEELFFKVLHILERGELATLTASERAASNKEKAARILENEMDRREVEDLFDVMTPRYLLNCTPMDIARHIRLARTINNTAPPPADSEFGFEAEKNEAKDCWEITLVARDRPGLFSDISGVMALNNINILSAEIYTWQDGTAVDIFHMSPPPDRIHAAESWERVRRDLGRTLQGKLSLDYRLDKKAAPSVLSTGGKPTKQPGADVSVDNTSSDFFTLIEVFAEDRVGLLYQVTHALFNLRLDIRIAKIATKGDRTADVFYVRDFLGQKVEDPERVGEIQRALSHILAGSRGAPFGNTGTG